MLHFVLSVLTGVLVGVILRVLDWGLTNHHRH